MKLCFAKNIQSKDRAKASIIFSQFMNKEIHARKMKHGRFTVLDVGLRVRIVIREKKAEVMSHEAYNNLQFRVI